MSGRTRERSNRGGEDSGAGLGGWSMAELFPVIVGVSIALCVGGCVIRNREQTWSEARECPGFCGTDCVCA